MRQHPSNPDCRRFEKQLESLLTGALPAEDLARAATHRAACARCAHLLEVLRGERLAADLPNADAFVADFLRTTVGSACARAETQLCAWVDSQLDEIEADLVALHVEHCVRCAALAAVLRALPGDLSALREIDPGPEFAPAVLARARRAMQRVPWLARARDAWQDLLLRPRAAMELATAGSFVLLLLCGLPFSPMRDVPRQALSVAQINPVAAATSAAERLQPVWHDYGAAVWDETGARAVAYVRTSRADFAAQRPRAAEAWDNLGTHGAAAGRAIWQVDGTRFSEAVRSLGNDFESLWDGLWNVTPATSEAVPQPSEE